MCPEKRSPPGQEAGGEREATGDGPFSTSTVAPPAAIVNAYDRFALDPDIDYPIAGPDPLMGVFAADYYELRALQRRREGVTP